MTCDVIMSRDTGTEENTSHFHNPPQANKPVPFTYRRPSAVKPISFSFKPPLIRQKLVLSPRTDHAEQDHVFQIANDNQTENCQQNAMETEQLDPQCMEWNNTNSHSKEEDEEMIEEEEMSHVKPCHSEQNSEMSPKKKVKLGKCNSSPITKTVPRDTSNVSRDTNNVSRDSTPDLEVYEEDVPEECDTGECRHVTQIDTKVIDRFFRRGRSESVCRLITNIYDSDESGWSSDDASVTSRDNLVTSLDDVVATREAGPVTMKGLASRKGRSASSTELIPAKPRVVPTGPVVRRSTTDNLSTPAKRTASRSWGLIKQVVHWSPFVQVYKKKYPWVQLAGHNGAFKPCDNGTILKKLTEKEYVCLNKILDDSYMLQITPKFHGKLEKEGVEYVKLQDLLAEFDNPSVCDIKMGTRTYLEEELIKAREKLTMRKDMYEKMVKVDKNEPTEEEHNFKAVTKPRYMQWRERLSSTATLGFRIDGIKQADRDPDKNFKTVRTNQEVAYVLRKHIDYRDETRLKLLERLKEIRSTLEKSKFFASHEVIGSSLLLVHDQPTDGVARANVWMIDFGKTTPLNGEKALDHRTPWVEGNQEDGYLFGLDNLVELFENLSTIPAPEGLEDDQPAVG